MATRRDRWNEERALGHLVDFECVFARLLLLSPMKLLLSHTERMNKKRKRGDL